VRCSADRDAMRARTAPAEHNHQQEEMRCPRDDPAFVGGSRRHVAGAIANTTWAVWMGPRS
jgi:hypothetical protein